MNNEHPDQHDDDMLPEYDFSGGVRGKHAEAMRRGYRIVVHKTDGSTEVREMALPEGAVLLDPDVRAYFPDAATVNTALRGLIQLIPRQPVGDETA